MQFQKGHEKKGGRQKGSVNKTTATAKEWVECLLCEGRETFAKKMAKLSPEKYCTLYAAMLNYVMPKQQAVSIEQQTEAEYRQLESLLTKAPEEAAEIIAQKVIAMQQAREQNLLPPTQLWTAEIFYWRL